MRAAPFLALLCLACICAASEPSSIAGFIAFSFEPDVQAQSSQLSANGSYYFISAGGAEIYVVDAISGNAVSDRAQLAGILEQDMRSRESFEAKISSAEAFPQQVKDAKYKSEALCAQYIGDDGDPGCNDRQSCLVSCFSVPQCEIIVQSDGFLESAMDWNLKRKDFASGLGSFSSGIGAIRFDSRAIDARIATLANISALAANMSQNGIFLEKEEAGCTGPNATRRCYEYCPKIDYSPALISAQSQNLVSLKGTLSKVAQQGQRADDMLNRSAENDAYLASRGKNYADFRMRMANDMRSLKAEANELSKQVNDSQAAALISQLEGVFALASNYSAGGFYKKALALQPQFESLSNATSERLDMDKARYISLSLGMEGYSAKVAGSAWLIGNQSADAHQSQLAALKGNYSLPLLPAEISEANATLAQMDAALASEIAAKASQAGGQQPLPSQQASGIPEYVWVAAIIIAAALAYSFMLSSARRAPPPAPPQASPQ